MRTRPKASQRCTSTEIRRDGSRGQMTGDLTIKDVTRQVTLQVSYLGHARDPWENDRASFEALGHIDREDLEHAARVWWGDGF